MRGGEGEEGREEAEMRVVGGRKEVDDKRLWVGEAIWLVALAEPEDGDGL